MNNQMKINAYRKRAKRRANKQKQISAMSLERSNYDTNYNNNRYLLNNNNKNMKMTIGRFNFDGFPDVLEMSFTYYENNYRFDLSTTDQLLYYNFSLNDPYDPYISIGGKSANQFYQAMSLYRSARVFRAIVVIKYVDNPSANTCPIQTALVYNSEGIVYADMDDIISLPNSKRISHTTMPNRVGGTQTISGTFYPNQGFLMTQSQWFSQPLQSPYDVTNNGGIVSPVNNSVLSFYYGRVDTTNTDQLSNRGSVSIQYFVRLSDRQAFPE